MTSHSHRGRCHIKKVAVVSVDTTHGDIIRAPTQTCDSGRCFNLEGSADADLRSVSKKRRDKYE